MKILIVDNDTSIITTLKALLASYPEFEVDSASGGQESLNKMAANHNYSLVILDIMMPNISGMDVCQAMSDDPNLQEIPVLLMSSAIPLSPEDYQASLEKSNKLRVVKGVIEKPFVIEDLVAQIHKYARLM